MKPAFPEISKIPYEGRSSKNPLAFKHYDPTNVIEDRTMADHLRFSVAYWHTFRNTLSDPFGVGTAIRPWDDGSNSVENACNRARVAFEFIEKLGAPFYAFHDRDVAPEGTSLAESNRNLDAVVKVLKEEQQRTGIKLLWATACLFINPRFAHGAATSPNADVFVYAAAQVKKAIDVAYELGAEGYVFWRRSLPQFDGLYSSDFLLAPTPLFLSVARSRCLTIQIGELGSALVRTLSCYALAGVPERRSKFSLTSKRKAKYAHTTERHNRSTNKRAA
jgi:xylose isomerase